MSSGYINIPAYGSASWKDPVDTALHLPSIGNNPGDVRVTLDTDVIYVWSGSSWSAASGTGVTSLNSLTGGLSLIPGTGITITPSGSTIQIAATASGSVTNVTASAPLASSGGATPNISITGSALTEATSSVLTITGGSAALLSAASIQVKQSSTSQSGYLSNTDWNTFNNKQSALTIGNLTDAGTDGITITGGSGAVIGTGTSIAQHVSDATHNGYLASTDFNTFSAKQPAGNYITALTGDVTASGPGSVGATLATVNSNVGSFTNANITVNAKGLITAASSGSSSGATATPTTMQSNLTIPDHTQLLYRRRIIMSAGQQIIIGTDAVLVGV